VFKGALQLRGERYRQIRFAQVPERVSTKSFVVLIIGNSKSNHLGAQGTFQSALVVRDGGARLTRGARIYMGVGDWVCAVAAWDCKQGRVLEQVRWLWSNMQRWMGVQMIS